MQTSDVPLADSAQEVLTLARKEADRFQHEYVGTEHVALALTRLMKAPQPPYSMSSHWTVTPSRR